MNQAVHDKTSTAVTEQILHEDFRAQVREGEAAPLDIALDELVPSVMGNARIIVPAGTQMHDVLQTSLLRVVQEILALAHHVDGVAGGQQRAVDALNSAGNRLWVIEIEVDHRHAKAFRLLGRPRGGNDFDFRVVF
jgi:hypothetical protein